MKKIVVALVFFVGIAHAKPVRLPSSQKLYSSLEYITLSDFLHKTDLITNLANQEKEPKDIAKMVESSIDDYLTNGLPCWPVEAVSLMKGLFEKIKEPIIRMILMDHEEALLELESQGLIKTKQQLLNDFN